MARDQKPTDSELVILDVLWRHGPLTVRDVQSALPRDRPMGYTTVLKLLQIMHDKSLVQRDESSRAHVYGARVERDNTQRGLVEDLLHKGFGGSSHDLVLRALESRPVSREELQSLRELLDRLEVEDGE